MSFPIDPTQEYNVRCPKCAVSYGIAPIKVTKLADIYHCPYCLHEALGAAFIDETPFDKLKNRVLEQANSMADNGLRTSTMPKTTSITPPKVTDNTKLDLLEELQKRVIGQGHVLDDITSVFYKWEVGMSNPQAPAGTFLLLGPTGTGKTYTVEALAEILLGNRKNFIKIDCAEFAHSHEIAKLIGSPPGYLGHRETAPALTQDTLAKYYSDRYKCTLLLFDEIEKASDALWNLLLGILDKATLTLGDNRKVDFSNVFIFMTSNLGAREMQAEIEPMFGFHESNVVKVIPNQKKLEDIALQAARKKFTPEFMNRIDAKLVYRTLSRYDLSVILEQLLDSLQLRIDTAKGPEAFFLDVQDDVRELLLSVGVSRAYGARELKRAIETHLSLPLVHLMRDGKFKGVDTLKVSMEGGKCKFAAAK